MQTRTRLLIFLLLIPLAGCSGGPSDWPKLHPVKGKITRGGQPVGAGTVQFAPERDEGITISGVVTANGEFELQSIKDDQKYSGAPEGTYQVTYIPTGTDQNIMPVQAARPVKVEARENNVTVELPKK